MTAAGYPHIHSRYERYAPTVRFAPAVDMTGCGQLLRTCPQPLDNPLNNLPQTGHFYFGNHRTFLLCVDTLDWAVGEVKTGPCAMLRRQYQPQRKQS